MQDVYSFGTESPPTRIALSTVVLGTWETLYDDTFKVLVKTKSQDCLRLKLTCRRKKPEVGMFDVVEDFTRTSTAAVPCRPYQTMAQRKERILTGRVRY